MVPRCHDGKAALSLPLLPERARAFFLPGMLLGEGREGMNGCQPVNLFAVSGSRANDTG